MEKIKNHVEYEENDNQTNPKQNMALIYGREGGS
jgi:hypothetical protein